MGSRLQRAPPNRSVLEVLNHTAPSSDEGSKPLRQRKAVRTGTYLTATASRREGSLPSRERPAYSKTQLQTSRFIGKAEERLRIGHFHRLGKDGTP